MAETPHILANNLAAKATITGQQGANTKYKLARLVDGFRYSRWQSNDTVLKNLDFDVPVGYQRPATCFILDRNHTLSGVACRFLYADNAGGPWTQVDTFTPVSSAVVFRRYTGQTAHRYYRLELGNSAELHRINQVWFGEGWQMEFPPENLTDGDAERIEYSDLETEAGVVIRTDRFKKRMIDVPMKLITPQEYAKIKTFFADLALYRGFLWYAELPDTNPSDIIYCIHMMKERRFPKSSNPIYREGTLKFEEVLGG